MSIRRFMVPEADLSADTVLIGGDLFRHMARVLRLKIDTPVILADGRGTECVGFIREMGRHHLAVAITERKIEPLPSNAPNITLIQGLPKGDKMELILQKTTELGVNEIVPFLADRTISRIPSEREGERVRRWRRIAEEAARQAGRIQIPAVRLARGIGEAIGGSAHDLRILLWEEEQTTTLKEAISKVPTPRSIAVIVGPEGGLTMSEAETARKAGFIPVTLGRRILRTDTAGMAIVAILEYLFGDLGNTPYPRAPIP